MIVDCQQAPAAALRGRSSAQPRVGSGAQPRLGDLGPVLNLFEEPSTARTSAGPAPERSGPDSDSSPLWVRTAARTPRNGAVLHAATPILHSGNPRTLRPLLRLPLRLRVGDRLGARPG
jgi:hypothetical protein